MRACHEDGRWAAVLARDGASDSAFVFAVRTTGIYCRPGCPARHPKPENVVFFDSPAAAERAGFRACLRCRPDEIASHAGPRQAVLQACRLIAESEAPPSLRNLADAAGLSHFHFQRVFKRELGITPKQYADARRQARARELLPSASSVTAAFYDAGYESAARFYAQASRALGMAPRDYKAGGRDQAIWYALADSVLGRVLIAGTARGLCAIMFADQDADFQADLQDRFPRAQLIAADQTMAEWVAETVGYIALPKGAFGLPLDIQGTAFQHKVWAALRDIPFGETATYSDIARKIGAPSATRAVATACGANPVAVGVPCHRVLRADGGMGGYRWGIARKRALLECERVRD
jgi:AraC family transcriptional regulator, regulatory protein of adaptative response / methylated-DNA-[protein]-cysteine methyltransferase